jgi:hypothetical protein
MHHDVLPGLLRYLLDTGTGKFATSSDLIHAIGVQDMYQVHRFNFRDLDEDSGWMHAIAMEVSFWIKGQPFTIKCT